MKKLLSVFLILICYQVHSQYYYKDIVAAADLSRQMKTYSANAIHKVTATGITPEGTASTEFSEVYEINGAMFKVTTTINNVVSSLRHNFNDAGLLLATIDSAAGVRSVSNYSYDENGRILKISNTSTDADSSAHFSQNEVHQYYYRDGRLDKMWRVINMKDSLEVRFVVDDKGNVIEERSYRRGIASDPIYYYYDDKNRLTDIVRFNYKANRLLPDYLFEYDENDRMIQKITTTSGKNIGYLTWRYLFNEKGLKTKEALFNKDKQLQGRIDYTYN